LVFVANGSDNTVSVINSSTDTVVGSPVGVGTSPNYLAISPDRSTAYVTDSGANEVSVINTATDKVINQIPLPGARGLAITPDGSTVYVTGGSSDTSLIPITTATDEVGAAIGVGSGAAGVAITPDGSHALVVNQLGGSLSVVNLTTSGVSTITGVGSLAANVAVTANGLEAYVTVAGGQTVTPVNLVTLTTGSPITVCSGAGNPDRLAISGSTAYVGCWFDDTVVPVNLTTATAGTPIVVGPSGDKPVGVAVTPDGKTVYAAVSSPVNDVVPITTATDTAGTAIGIGQNPSGLAITPDQAPVAELSVTPEPAGTPTSFDASASVAPSSAIASYFWSFGDGNTQTTSVPTATHTYVSADTYTATVTETDTAGTSTSQVFTGQTVSLDGGPGAVATASVVIVSCTSAGTCSATVSSPATPNAPAQTVQAVGRPTSPTGTFVMSLTPQTLVCKKVNPAPAPVTTLTDTGFAATGTITVTVVLKHTIRPKSHQVCFNSTVPFKSQSSPHTPKVGTALLLTCSKTHNVAPCLQSSVQKGPNVDVRFSIPGGDPRFHIVAPTQLGVSTTVLPAATVNKAYKYQLNVDGGTPPIHWKISAGKLPTGLTISTSTGTITGKPSKTGTFGFTVMATDSEQPPESSALALSITVK